jgi:hypothetical protein
MGDGRRLQKSAHSRKQQDQQLSVHSPVKKIATHNFTFRAPKQAKGHGEFAAESKPITQRRGAASQ